MQATTHNVLETQAMAAEFAATLHGGELILLIGDLGAGKTAFVQGLATALGVTARVTSPTFSIMNEYPADRGAIRRVVHLDLYRFTNENELRALALDDERRPDSVMLIEWPNVIAHDFTADVVIAIEHAGGDARTITITR